ncbi:MAG TPA: SURF1 family cytochrome oxidase biogenesis protein [Vitreimonas sp.]|uniref:SURF1 family cytochrome oxidase biogenesis protein n=1 Tax=Vitreimonas sp. TaxID=3069702 RepID=UPI002D2D1312|nr:SURF1 family cytochrome oxidase biogenesis protein [Vitreimonas sp.]HYD87284.1 SURF1 family cytochrome oxidase biogenesis protein [Vitreimonas sp.]
MIRFRPLLLMSVAAVLAFAALLLLGRWQWERYELKKALAEEPVPEMTIANYQPIAEGMQFVHGVRTDTREQGWRVFAPVQYGDTVVFVDADFVPGVEPPSADEVRVPALLRLGAPISGASIRPEEAGPFTLAPRPLQRLWFAIDLPAMGRNAGLENVADYYVASAYVGADGRATANPFALATGADTLPPERHMGYAITWYGLAIVLIVIYFAYHASVGRLSFAPPRRPEE